MGYPVDLARAIIDTKLAWEIGLGYHGSNFRANELPDWLEEYARLIYEDGVVPPPTPACITAFLLPLMGLGTLLPYLRLFRSHLPRLTVETYYKTSDKIMGVIT